MKQIGHVLWLWKFSQLMNYPVNLGNNSFGKYVNTKSQEHGHAYILIY